MINISHNSHGETTALISRPEYGRERFADENYYKFTYSTKYRFCVESDLRNFYIAVFDHMLGLNGDKGISRLEILLLRAESVPKGMPSFLHGIHGGCRNST